MELLLNFIKLSHLSALGLEENHLYLILVIACVLVSYFIVQPFIEWLVILQSTKLLSYIVCSLMIILVFFTVAIFFTNISQNFFIILDKLLKVLALFGGLIIIYSCIRHFMRKV